MSLFIYVSAMAFFDIFAQQRAVPHPRRGKSHDPVLNTLNLEISPNTPPRSRWLILKDLTQTLSSNFNTIFNANAAHEEFLCGKQFSRTKKINVV